MRRIVVALSSLLIVSPVVADRLTQKPATQPPKKYQWFHPWFKTTFTADEPPAWPYRIIEERPNVIILEVTPPNVEKETPPEPEEPAKVVPTYTNSTPYNVARTNQQQSNSWRIAEAGASGGITGLFLAIVLSIIGLIWVGVKKAYTAVRSSDSIRKVSKAVKETASTVAENLSTPEYNPQTYAQALQEIEAGTVDRGLWAKALVSANGDESKARAAYIKYRVKDLNAHL